MLTKKKKQRPRQQKLSRVILEYLVLSVLVSLFTFLFLYTTSVSIGVTYIQQRGITITQTQELVFHVWLRSICAIASILIFTVLFLFMLGQRLSYLITIIKGIGSLQESRMDYTIPLTGNDELTQLAGSINYLAASERELNRREQELTREREAWIRSLSHDIRTPLTSMLSYSELMREKLLRENQGMTQEDMLAYIDLVYSKAQQIQELSSQLTQRGDGTWENIDDIRLLFEQLAGEWEEILEDRYSCTVDLTGCESFSGQADVYALRRITDNLASNVEKYADPDAPVQLSVRSSGREVRIVQVNGKRADPGSFPPPPSSKIGIGNIQRIARIYDGRADVSDESGSFRIEILLNIRPCS